VCYTCLYNTIKTKKGKGWAKIIVMAKPSLRRG
jgi:hypothetical protein